MASALESARVAACIWGVSAAGCVLMYILFCASEEKKVEAKQVATFALWPIVLLLLVIRGAKEACEWALHGDGEEPEEKP